jgi:kinesin family protein 5
MNRMEAENKSDLCMEVDADTTVQLRNSASLAGPEKDGEGLGNAELD